MVINMIRQRGLAYSHSKSRAMAEYAVARGSAYSDNECTCGYARRRTPPSSPPQSAPPVPDLPHQASPGGGVQSRTMVDMNGDVYVVEVGGEEQEQGTTSTSSTGTTMSPYDAEFAKRR